MCTSNISCLLVHVLLHVHSPKNRFPELSWQIESKITKSNYIRCPASTVKENCAKISTLSKQIWYGMSMCMALVHHCSLLCAGAKPSQHLYTFRPSLQGQRSFAWIEPSSLFLAQLGSLRGSNLLCPVSVAFTTGCCIKQCADELLECLLNGKTSLYQRSLFYHGGRSE